MSGLNVLPRVESVNGVAKRPAKKPQKQRAPRKGMKHARRLACAVGAVGVGVLGLSVAHCTESIRKPENKHPHVGCRVEQLTVAEGVILVSGVEAPRPADVVHQSGNFAPESRSNLRTGGDRAALSFKEESGAYQRHIE